MSNHATRQKLALLAVICSAAILLSAREAPQNVTATAPLTYALLATSSSAPAGFASIAAPANSVTVTTAAVTANSQILVQFDETTGAGCSVGVGALEGNRYYVSTRSPGSSFTIKAAAALPTGDTACLSYFIVN